MQALLFFPPVSDPTLPPHGIARLAGFLRARGRSVRTHDLNVAFFHSVLGPGLAETEEALQRSVRGLEAQDTLSPAEWERYVAQARALLLAAPVIENVEAAKQVMRDRRWFDDPNTYNWALQVLLSGLRVLSARYHPSNIGFHNWSSGAPLDLDEIHRCLAVDDPFRPFYAATLPDLVPPEGPVLFGVSIMFLDQLVPALMLAAELKRLRPDAHVTLGGATITHLSDQAMRLLDAFDFLDSLVPGAGEVPLLELVDGAVPTGILSRGAASPTHAEIHRFDVTDSPPPYYAPEALPLYLSPEAVLPIRGSRGCYWGRCVYCSHHFGEGRYAPRSAAAAFEELTTLRREHGARYFYLSDDALSPRFIRDFSELILAAEPDGPTVRWLGDARPEDLDEATIEKAARAGLVMLFLGVESASPRIRGLMQRGGEMARVRRSIAACHRAGILLKLNFIFGFPGETQAELDETLAFIDEVRTPADVLGLHPFFLMRGSPMQIDRTPTADAPSAVQRSGRSLAGLDVVVHPKGAFDLSPLYDFVTSDGRTAQETIDEGLARIGGASRHHASAWKVADMSRTHRALMHHLHEPADFLVERPPTPEATSAQPQAPVEDPIVRARPPVRARTFRYNLASPVPAPIPPTSFLCDELVRFPNHSGEIALCGVHPALGALIEGELREGLRWTELGERLADVPDGGRAVEVLLAYGLLEV